MASRRASTLEELTHSRSNCLIFYNGDLTSSDHFWPGCGTTPKNKSTARLSEDLTGGHAQSVPKFFGGLDNTRAAGTGQTASQSSEKTGHYNKHDKQNKRDHKSHDKDETSDKRKKTHENDKHSHQQEEPERNTENFPPMYLDTNLNLNEASTQEHNVTDILQNTIKQRTKVQKPKKRGSNPRKIEGTANLIFSNEKISAATYKCYCKTPFDLTKFHVQCISCMLWHHGCCVDILQDDLEGARLFVCSDCKPKGEPRCICGELCDPKRFYVTCGTCKKNFHGSCVGVSRTDSLFDPRYNCLACMPSDWKQAFDSVMLNESEKEDLRAVLEQLKRHHRAEIFKNPVTEQIAPNYFSIIKEPMDFSKIDLNINQNKYSTLKQFINDFLIMFENCRCYNHPSTTYFMAAEIMEFYFIALMRNFRMDMQRKRERTVPSTQTDGIELESSASEGELE